MESKQPHAGVTKRLKHRQAGHDPADPPAINPADAQPVWRVVVLTSLLWLALGGVALFFWRKPQPATFEIAPPPATHTPSTAAPSEPPALAVAVSGAVARPGVYRLPADAQVLDAIDAAGGLQRDADRDALDMGRALHDGELIAVATRAGQAAATAQPATRGAGVDDPAGSRIDLNTATAQELEALPAIGPVTAQAIVDYRADHGPFRSVQDLLEVKGIGEATLDRIKDLVEVGE